MTVQVCKHLEAIAKPADVAVVPILGGMAVQKQSRLLGYRPPVVVATPGRLWELMRDGQEHLTNLAGLSFLVLDEADRMLQQGHFQVSCHDHHGWLPDPPSSLPALPVPIRCWVLQLTEDDHPSSRPFGTSLSSMAFLLLWRACTAQQGHSQFKWQMVGGYVPACASLRCQRYSSGIYRAAGLWSIPSS